MPEYHRPFPVDVLFEDRVTLSDGHSKPYSVLLQLTSESLIIQRVRPVRPSLDNSKHTARDVIIERNPDTGSLGFSIKGGRDTGRQPNSATAVSLISF